LEIGVGAEVEVEESDGVVMDVCDFSKRIWSGGLFESMEGEEF